jgi:hypothetical protein
MNEHSIQEVLHGLVGQRCQWVDNPVGSILLIDIGPVSAEGGETSGLRPRSWRHLTVECPWRLQSQDRVLCDWNDDGGVGGLIERTVSALHGQSVTGASAIAPAWDLKLTFSGGLSLFAFADSNDLRADAWSILGTDGLEAAIGPEREGRPGCRLRWKR